MQISILHEREVSGCESFDCSCGTTTMTIVLPVHQFRKGNRQLLYTYSQNQFLKSGQKSMTSSDPNGSLQT